MADDPFAKYVKEDSPSSSNEADPFAKYTKDAPKSDKVETTALGAGAASAAESALTIPPSLYAGGMAAAAMPGPPLAKAAAGVVGGVVGGIIGYEGIKTVEQVVDSVLGTNLAKTREAQQQQHPIASTVGGVVGFAAGPGNTVGLQSAGKMLAGGTLMTGIGAAQRAITGGDILDTKSGAIDFLSGAVIKPSALGEKIMTAGAKAGSRTPRVDPILEELKKTQESLDKPHVDTVIPKVVETAFRKKDGTIVRSGPKHNEAHKAAGVDEPGFVTENNEFLTRHEALDRARETGQIPEDHQLEKPEEGLHSGDMRTAKDSNFELPPEKVDPFTWNIDKEIEKHSAASNDDVKFEIRESLQTSVDTLRKEAENARAEAKAAQLKRDTESEKRLNHLANSYEEKLNYIEDKMPPSHIRDKVLPSWRETHDIIRGSKTVGEAFDKILESRVGSTGQKQLLELLKKSSRVNDTSITELKPDLVDPKTPDTAALYYIYNNTVKFGKGTNLRVVLHEAVHAATAHLLDIGEHSSAKELQKLFELAKSSTTDEHYGLTDVREFVSEAFTKKQFQEYLHSLGETGLPIPERSAEASLWDKFKSIIKRGLGVKTKDSRTAIDDVLDHGAALVEAADSVTPSKKDYDTLASPMEDPATNAGREKFIDSMVKKYGEGYREAATKLYDTKYANEGIVPANHSQLGDLFYAIGKQGEADAAELFGRAVGKVGRFIMSSIGDKSKAEGFYQKASQEGVTPEIRAKWRLAAEGKVKLNSAEQTQYDKYIKWAEDELATLTKRQSDLGRVKELNFNEDETGKHIPRIAVPKRKTGIEFIKSIVESDQGGFNADITRDVGAVKEQGFFAVEKPDGTRVVIMPKGKDIVGYTNKGKQYKFGQNVTSDGKGGIREVRAGDKYGGWRIKEARVDEIEAVTPYRYLKDYQAVVYKRLQEARSFDRAHNHLDNLMKSDYFKSVAKLATDKDVDPAWKTLASSDKLPRLAGYKFEPMVAATLEDYAKVWQPNAITWVTSGIIKNMMLNPLPHMNNEAWHWYNARGLSGWTTPKGVARFLRTMPSAMKSVVTQDHFYTEIMKNGGSILGADVRNSNTYKEILQKGLKEATADPSFVNSLVELGLSTKSLYDAVSKYMSISMWTVRDAMYLQLVKEQQLRGKDLRGAIKEVERHMPSYRIEPTVLGSRNLSKILQNPNVSVFSRYHFGMAKSLMNTAKDMAGQGPEGRGGIKQGLDQAAAMVFALAVLYPMLDYGAQALFDDKRAKIRRAGPYHLFEAVHDVSTGDKEPLSLLQPVFTFNPVLLAGIQLPFNREFYTGKQIYHPADKSSIIAKDLGMYALKQVPQVSTGLRVSAKNAGGSKQWAAQQLDIKIPTEKQVKDKEKWKIRNQRAAEKRKRLQEMGN